MMKLEGRDTALKGDEGIMRLRLWTKELLTLCALCAFPTVASTQTLICQYETAAGMVWENDNWRVTEFVPFEPFLLDVREGRIDPLSISGSPLEGDFPLVNSPNGAHCVLGNLVEGVGAGFETCTDAQGNTLFFNFNNFSGATAKLTGGALEPGFRSLQSIGVATFQCRRAR